MFNTADIYDDHDNRIAISVTVMPGWGEGHLEVGYNHDQTYTGNHIDAARQFLDHMEWASGKWFRFPYGDDGYAFVNDVSLALAFDFDAEDKP